MGLKPGYKQTEVGVIPEEWNDGCLGDNTKKIGSGITPTGGERVYKQEGRPFLRSQNVGWGALLMEDIAFIDEVTHESFKGTEIQLDDVFLNITGASIGRSAVADARVVRGNVNQHVCIVRTDQDRLHPRFLNNFLLSRQGQRQIDSFQAGGNRQGLNFGQIRSFRLPLPPIPEQRAIAEALSDADALIGALDRLIAKKRDLKQAAMQQLLTGQKRLPGFSGEWEVKRLATVCAMKSGQGITDANIDGFSKFPCYGGNGLRGFTSRFTHNGCHALIGRQGALCGNVLSVEGMFFASEHAIVVTAFPQTDIHWLAYVLEKMRLNQYSESSAQPGLSVAKLLNLDLAVPPSKGEQTAIAEVLSDMDAEIAALERRRDKTRALKQGMMQELLTGRTRLVDSPRSYGQERL
jgi:type I restriction enzyme S subunit